MKTWSFAVVIDCVTSVEDGDTYAAAASEIDNGMQEFASSVAVEDYTKGVDSDGHAISWVIEPQEMVNLTDDAKVYYAIYCKIMLDINSSMKPDVLKLEMKNALLQALPMCPALKLSKKYLASKAIE